MNRSASNPACCFFTPKLKSNWRVLRRSASQVFWGALWLAAILTLLSQEKGVWAQGNETETSAVPSIESKVGGEDKTKSRAASETEPTVSEEFEESNVLFLEIVWMRKSLPCEALLVVPEKRVPMALVRILDEKDRLTRLWAARVALSADDDPTGIQAQCFEPKKLWDVEDEEGVPNEKESGGEKDAEERGEEDGGGASREVPELIVIQGTRGAVDLGGDLAPCLVLPVTKENESAIFEKYLAPTKDRKEDRK